MVNLVKNHTQKKKKIKKMHSILYENGVLTMLVENHTPPPKSKTVEVAIA